MATEDTVGSDRESQDEVDAVLAETSRTMDQVRRWRREGLLPDVVQDRQAYRGSVVLYPKGTCAQIRAASALFKEKNRVDYVGHRLWILWLSGRRQILEAAPEIRGARRRQARTPSPSFRRSL
ncbi:MAG TPA: hypothetical protein VFE60_13510 [Roseiarcus sp.]|jgi:hypothetical protein|nr:hypothetical protein [Roseiarcus sp.]